MQSTCLEEAGASGSFAEDSTLIGLTFGGYLRSKVCRHVIIYDPGFIPSMYYFVASESVL